MKMEEIVDINYFNFKQKYLVQDYRGTDGQPVHTRYLKSKFYRFAKQLKDEFGFDMFTCSECGCTEHNGRPIVMELDHLNRITNDYSLTIFKHNSDELIKTILQKWW